MQNTTNFNLQKPDYNNVADIGVLNGNFDKIDKGLNPFYVATQSGANTYKVITGANKTTLANGYGIRVAILTPSDGAVSIIVDGCSAVPVKKANGNPVKNFKQNGVYSLTYYNSVFILASGGIDDVNFSASDLLTGKNANNSDGEKVDGTMPNIGQQTATINAGGKTMIKKGYHDGTGYIQSNSMGTQLSNLGVTLTSASELVSGIKAVDKNGNLITGTATIQSLGGKEYKTGSNVATTQHVWGSGSYRVMSYVDNFRVIAGKISYKDKIFVYINDSSICSYPITVCWDDKNSRYSVGTASNEFSPTQPMHVGIPVFYDSTNNNSIVVTNYIAWE